MGKSKRMKFTIEGDVLGRSVDHEGHRLEIRQTPSPARIKKAEAAARKVAEEFEVPVEVDPGGIDAFEFQDFLDDGIEFDKQRNIGETVRDYGRLRITVEQIASPLPELEEDLFVDGDN